jgi:cytochrome P450
MAILYEIMEGISKVLETGASPPEDLVPLFRCLPQKLWNNWKDNALEVRGLIDSLYPICVAHVQNRRSNVGSKGSFLDMLIDNQEKLGMTDHQISMICGTLAEGGTDTTGTMLTVLLQALPLNRDALLDAQREIDAVVGTGRSPVWADYDRLPHVNMIVKEIMRWRPVAPASLPHVSGADDEIDGMYIPKGATIVMNTWAMHHNPDLHERPDEFNPYRYKDFPLPSNNYSSGGEGQRDHYSYGSGRRICPGIHLAERGMWIGAAKLLWAFDFQQARDPVTGDVIPVDTNPATGYSAGFLVGPKPFRVDVKVRSEAHREIIFREYEAAKEDFYTKYDDEVDGLL